MFQIHVMQNQWVFLAVFGGLALMLTLLLAYPPFWKPREEGSERKTFFQWFHAATPWYLFVLYATVIVYVIAYVIRMSKHPPNF